MDRLNDDDLCNIRQYYHGFFTTKTKAFFIAPVSKGVSKDAGKAIIGKGIGKDKSLNAQESEWGIEMTRQAIQLRERYAAGHLDRVSYFFDTVKLFKNDVAQPPSEIPSFFDHMKTVLDGLKSNDYTVYEDTGGK